MQGRRLADTGAVDLSPGDYRRQEETVGEGDTRGTVVVWYVRPPKGQVQRISAEHVTEHEDGSITCSEPISNDEGSWSLVGGVWQEPRASVADDTDSNTRRKAARRG